MVRQNCESSSEDDQGEFQGHKGSEVGKGSKRSEPFLTKILKECLFCLSQSTQWKIYTRTEQLSQVPTPVFKLKRSIQNICVLFREEVW